MGLFDEQLGEEQKPARKPDFRQEGSALASRQGLFDALPQAKMFPEFATERADPVTVPSTIADRATSFTQMLVGPQLGMMGVKWDEKGWNSSVENIKKQWSEEPLYSNLVTLAMTAALAAPVAYSARYGALGKALGKGFQFADRAGVLGNGSQVNPTYWFKQFPTAEHEAMFLKRMGVLAGDARGTPRELRNARLQAHRKLSMYDTHLKQKQLESYEGEVIYHAKKANPELAKLDNLGLNEIPRDQLQAAHNAAMAAGAMPPDVGFMEKLKWEFDKRFANTFFANANDVTPQGAVIAGFNDRMDQHFGVERLSHLGKLDAAGEADPHFAKRFFRKAMMEIDGKDRFPDLAPNPESDASIDGLLDYYRSNQASMIDTGFLREDAEALHINALRDNGVKYNVRNLADMSNVNASLAAPTLLQKKTDLDGIAELAKKGALQLKNVKTIRQAGVSDDMLHFNYQLLRDVMVHRKFMHDPFATKFGGAEVKGVFGTPENPASSIISRANEGEFVGFEVVPYAEMIKRYGDSSLVPKNFVNADQFFKATPGGREAMLRMMKHSKYGNAEMITLDAQGRERLPFIPKFIAETFAGEAGIFQQSLNAVHALEATGMIHKGAKTGLNPGSHGQNILGGIAFLSMAGFNVLRSHNQNLLKQATDAFKDIHDVHVKVRKLHGAGAPNKLIQAETRMELANAGKYITHVKDGKEFRISYSDLARELPAQLYEAGSFDAIEGGEALATTIAQRGGTPAAKAINEVFQKVRGKSNKRPGTRGSEKEGGVYANVGLPVFGSVGKLFDNMSKWYLGEDIIPKLALYVHHRAGGLSELAAVSEVARRTPMYSTTGSWIKAGRKTVFPWASFPTEAARIMKNNLMDDPMKALPWLYAVQIAQATLAGVGAGEGNLQAVKDAKQQLPIWAQTPGTVMTASPSGSVAPHLLPGAAAGAMVGGAMGAAAGGAPGAILGAAAGVGINMLPAVNPWREKDENGVKLRGAILNWLPHTSFMLRSDSPQYGIFDEGISAKDALRRVYDTVPAEPFAILKPILDVMTGEGGFGEPIPGEGVFGATGNFFRGMLGFLAPPYLQKYGFKTGTPDVGLGELAASRVGLSLPDPVRQLGVTNVSKLLVDAGMNKDPMTGLPGNPIMDIILNGITGTLKSHPAVAERYFANEELNNKSMAEVRNFHSRNLSFHIQNGDDELAGDILRRVFMTFQQQYIDDPTKAVTAYDKWVKSKWDDIGKSKLLQNINKDELEEQYKASIDFAKDALNFSRSTRIDALKNERMVRRIHEEEQKAARKRGEQSGPLGPEALGLLSR